MVNLLRKVVVCRHGKSFITTHYDFEIQSIYYTDFALKYSFGDILFITRSKIYFLYLPYWSRSKRICKECSVRDQEFLEAVFECFSKEFDYRITYNYNTDTLKYIVYRVLVDVFEFSERTATLVIEKIEDHVVERIKNRARTMADMIFKDYYNRRLKDNKFKEEIKSKRVDALVEVLRDEP